MTREEKIKRKAVGYGLAIRDTMIMHGAKREPSKTISKIVQIAYLAGATEADANPINLWKPANGDDLPEIDREVIALTQPYPDDKHLRVMFAHRPSKYTKVWNIDLGEEQVVEVERYGKGGWDIPDVKYWLDVELPKEIEL